MRQFVFAMLLATFAGSLVTAGQDATPAAFDVVSIKRSLDTSSQAGIRRTPGRFTMENRPISAMVRFAFQGQITADIKGFPDWATTDHYNVIATTGGQHTAAEISTMLKKLLAERFKLVTHTVSEDRDGWALLRVNPGAVPAGLRKIDVDCEDQTQTLAAQRATPRSTPDGAPEPCITYYDKAMRSGGQSMSALARRISAGLETDVVDETGLDGYYAFNFTACEVLYGPGLDCEALLLPETTTAIREQLGLKLVRRKLTVTVLVIDHIERPTET